MAFNNPITVGATQIMADLASNKYGPISYLPDGVITHRWPHPVT